MRKIDNEQLLFGKTNSQLKIAKRKKNSDAPNIIQKHLNSAFILQ